MGTVKKFLLFSIGFLVLRFLCLQTTDGFCLQHIQCQIYSNNLKNREFGKEGAQILESGANNIVREQGASEDSKFAANPTQSKTDSSSCLGTPSSKENELVCPQLGQSFYYLGHGAQSYAFVSEDGQYVLKFYRHHRTKHPLSFLMPILPKIAKNRLIQTLAKRKRKQQKDFNSFRLANTYLTNETGLLYLHLEKTSHLPKSLTLFDKISVKHSINPNEYTFILQKKAEPVYEVLQNWIELNEMDQIKRGLTQIVTLLCTRAKKGLFDKDPDLKTNFGFTKEGPIQFDIGRFSLDESQANPAVYRDHLIRITDPLYQWLNRHDESLGSYLREEIEKI